MRQTPYEERATHNTNKGPLHAQPAVCSRNHFRGRFAPKPHRGPKVVGAPHRMSSSGLSTVGRTATKILHFYTVCRSRGGGGLHEVRHRKLPPGTPPPKRTPQRPPDSIRLPLQGTPHRIVSLDRSSHSDKNFERHPYNIAGTLKVQNTID